MSGAGIYIKTPSGLVAAATVPGVQGSQGPQSSLVPGTITTGAAGTSAAATITGAGPVQTLNLTIPRGNTGDPTAYELRGTGSPEGVVTAPVGTYYTDTALTNGAMRWAKKTGTGNTGWEVTVGDTGSRIINDAVAGFTRASGNVYIRRIGRHCYLSVDFLVPTASVNLGNGDMRLTIPTGFVPAGTQAGLFAKGNGLATVFSGATSGSTFYLGSRIAPSIVASWPTTDPLSGSLTYRTSDAWPTSLPGTAA